MYSPVFNPESSLKRRNTVLGQMFKYNYLNQLEFDSLKALPIELDYNVASHTKGIAPHFRKYCKNQNKITGVNKMGMIFLLTV